MCVALRVVVALTWAGAAGTASANAGSDQWQFRLTPYLWLPTIDGELRYAAAPGGGGPEVEVGPVDWLELLNYGAFLAGSASRGRYSLNLDLVYLNMSSNSEGRVASIETSITGPFGQLVIPVSAQLNLDTGTELDGLLLILAGGYQYSETQTASHSVYAGLRYIGIDVTTSWSLSTAITTPGGSVVLPAQGVVAEDTDLWDGIVGLRGHYGLGADKWSIPYQVDVGAGSSDLTWSAFAALAYQFKWGDLIFGYRHLEYDEGPDKLLQGFSFSGPVIGGRFSF